MNVIEEARNKYAFGNDLMHALSSCFDVGMFGD